MGTNVYIDGFNLYYGCVKGTSYKWLDLAALCARLLPRDELQRIRYYTAIIGGRAGNPDAPARQRTYIRALETNPLISVHYGHFLTNRVRMPLASPPRKGRKTVEVLKTEEKGSDVNLASHLLVDAFRGDCDTAVIVSNDSDLREPVRIAGQELGLSVGIINPHPAGKRSRELSSYAAFFKQIRGSALASCQLPETLLDAHGAITKPPEWA